MRLIISTILLLACIAARASEIDDTPKMQFIMELSVNIGSPLQVGDTGKGNRTIIPITGGTFSGPQIKGTVIPGGADYQLYDNTHKRNNLEAIYCIQTDDGESGRTADVYPFVEP